MLELVKAVLGLFGGALGGVAQRRASNRIAYTKERVAPVEAFVRASFAYYDKLNGILSVRGRMAPLTHETDRRAYPVSVTMGKDLSLLGRQARSAAELVDPTLLELLHDAEAAGVRFIRAVETTEVGVPVAPLLALLARGRAANRRVAKRLRQLQL